MQPTRLNVVKNDTDTWDYTNPNLGNMLLCLIDSIKLTVLYISDFYCTTLCISTAQAISWCLSICLSDHPSV